MGRAKKYNLILKGIDIPELLFTNYKYILGKPDNEELDTDFSLINSDINTQIEEADIPLSVLTHEKSAGKKARRAIYILDSHKMTAKYWLNMIDITQRGAIPRFTTKPCWWCRSKFSSHPLGCPIKYVPESTNEDDLSRIMERFKEYNLPLDDGTDFFLTEGLFCQFPCVKAYILDQFARTKSTKYMESLGLLTLFYLKLYNENIVIPVAGTWKNLIEYGGHQTPDEYRASIGNLEYNETVNTRRPLLFCTSKYIREKRVKT